MMEQSDHARLLEAGWAYRMKDNGGWVIYRDPATGLWHAAADAVRLLDSRVAA
jgi:hypothetical protein